MFITLNNIANSFIVNAGDTDFEYSGNMFADIRAYDNPEEKFRVYSQGCNANLEYSINREEYKEFEFLDENGYRPWSSKETNLLDLDGDSNMVTVRNINDKEIYLKAVLIQNGDYKIAIQSAFEGHTKGDGVNIANSNDGQIEVSVDGGETFQDVTYVSWGIYNLNVPAEGLFSKKLVVRNKQTGEEIYRTPEIGINIEDYYSFENGKTTVNFKNSDIYSSYEKFSAYNYVINGENYEGQSFEVTEDTEATLKIDYIIDFMDKSEQKDISIKVIKVDAPEIEKDEDGNLNIVPGNITNDELESIFYSINDGEEKEFNEKENLNPGTYKIKAYQISKDKNIKSEIVEKEIVIEEKDNEDENKKDDEEVNDEDEKQEDDKEVNDEDKETNDENEKEEAGEEVNTEDERKKVNEETNNENKQNAEDSDKNVDSKTTNNTPQTDDMISIFAIILVSIITLNIFVNNRKNK